MFLRNNYVCRLFKLTSTSKIKLNACYTKTIIGPKEEELSFNDYNISKT